jgi:predicted DNA binding CopG/RHH family protein
MCFAKSNRQFSQNESSQHAIPLWIALRQSTGRFNGSATFAGAMLLSMQSTANPSPASTAASFAGLLAALAAPGSKSGTGSKSPNLWNDDDLDDDVSVLSYERALSTHARRKPAGASDYGLTSAQDLAAAAGPVRIREVQVDEDAAPAPEKIKNAPRTAAPAEPARRPVPFASYGAQEKPQPSPAERKATAPKSTYERNLKSASITIRLSMEECDQLRERAAEAGLTVSAYLRSCTFEAENLRAMVKDAMAQLKSQSARPDELRPSEAKLAESKTDLPPKIPVRSVPMQWLSNLLPTGRASHRSMRA